MEKAKIECGQLFIYRMDKLDRILSLDALDDKIAELVAEALYDYLLRRGLNDKALDKQTHPVR